ncbi:MAG: hypothetical protein FJX23_08450 [Alphaproteobacteria bacterium]|nr:hypothetical protein [Alphaproteobacteria bacterium]
MPYIKPPMLPDDNLPLPFEDVLGHHLRTQLLQHREQVAKFDLSGFEGQPERTVEVTFGAPKWQMQEMAKPVIAHYVKRGEDEEVLKKAAESTIEDFIGKTKSDGWTTTRKQGDATVNFSEAIGDEKSIANPERHLTKELVFEDDVRFGIVDGRAITSSNKDHLAKSLPSLVKWLDSAKLVEKDGVMDFHPVIELMDATNVCIYPTKTLAIGGQLLAEADDQGVMIDILRHERGHVMNGDHDTNLMKSKVFREQLGPVNYLYQTMQEISGYIANPITIEGMDHQKTVDGIRAWGDEIVKAMDRVSLLADKARSFDWGGEEGALAVAADMDGKTSFLKHLSTLPKFEMDGFVKAEHELIASVEERQEAKQENPKLAAYRSEELQETRQALLEQIGRITPQHRMDFDVAEQSFQNVSKAREYLADIHAAQHSENPRRLHKVFDKFIDLGFGNSGGRTHPDNPERSCNAKHFADRVLFQREQAAKEAKDGQSR